MPISKAIDTVAHMTHKHSHHPHPGPTFWSELPEDFADYLDLEARLSMPVVEAALHEATAALGADPSLILDLGAGTGVGTFAMASRFASAQIRSIDISAQLLKRLDTAATAAGVADRVQVRQADLDGDWSSDLVTKADLAWAALSLHHVSDPARVLRQAFEALRPGGVLVVTEMTGRPRIEPGDLGSGRNGLWDGLGATLAEHSDPAVIDWSNVLDEAGFALVRRKEFILAVSAATAEGSRYLIMQLRSHRRRLADTLLVEELAGIDAAIEDLEAGTSDLAFTAGRAVWVVARPGEAGQRLKRMACRSSLVRQQTASAASTISPSR